MPYRAQARRSRLAIDEFEQVRYRIGVTQSGGVVPSFIAHDAPVGVPDHERRLALQTLDLTPQPVLAEVQKVYEPVRLSVDGDVLTITNRYDVLDTSHLSLHWEAADDMKIYQYNYEATKEAIQRAMKGEPKIEEILAKKDTAKHPFSPK